MALDGRDSLTPTSKPGGRRIWLAGSTVVVLVMALVVSQVALAGHSAQRLATGSTQPATSHSAQSAGAQPSYGITDIGAFPGSKGGSVALAVNATGQVTGYSFTST